jgi:hypothetical protein
MGSNPIIGILENAISRVKIVRIRDFFSHAPSRTKRPSIRQVCVKGEKPFQNFAGYAINDHEESLAEIATWRL